MSKDVDEDLIEATIRRVQAQSGPQQDESEEADEQAGNDRMEAAVRRVREQAASWDSEEDGDSGSSPDITFVDADDPIEAAIRRVQEQAEARASEASTDQSESEQEGDDDPIEATILRVQAEAAARADAASLEEEPAAPAEDDAIAETIRRVQAQAQSRHEESSAFAPAPLPPLDDDADPVEEAIQYAEAQEQLPEPSPAFTAGTWLKDAPPIEQTQWPGRDERLLGEPATWEIAAQRLEQGLQETNHELRALAARFDALLPALERVIGASDDPAPSALPLSVVPPRSSEREEWDDRPRISSMQFGTPPRPPIFRDPSPQTATAAELVEEPAEESPPAAAAPQLRTIAGRHGLDESTMPRQYRITVEDKRRGVDLVPLHRAMQGMDNVKDMSLLSYSNGVAIVLVESVGPIDPDSLGGAVAHAMARATKVEVHNEQTMVVKIQEE
jgi:hypothetical protein